MGATWFFLLLKLTGTPELPWAYLVSALFIDWFFCGIGDSNRE